MLTNLIEFYEDGLYREKLKKLDIRKDALMIVNVKQKYDVIAKKSKNFTKIKKNHLMTKLHWPN